MDKIVALHRDTRNIGVMESWSCIPRENPSSKNNAI